MNMIKIEKTNTIFAYYKKMPEDKNLQTFDSITKVVLIFAVNKFQTAQCHSPFSHPANALLHNSSIGWPSPATPLYGNIGRDLYVR